MHLRMTDAPAVGVLERRRDEWGAAIEDDLPQQRAAVSDLLCEHARVDAANAGDAAFTHPVPERRRGVPVTVVPRIVLDHHSLYPDAV